MKVGICLKFIYKPGLILFFLFIEHAVTAQIKGHEIKAKNQDVKISLTKIIGDWYTTDTSAYKMSFINSNNYFIDIIGINHRVGNYSFRIYGDSISVNGTAPNWPPYDCTLKLLNNKCLEIAFYQFFSTETTKVIYRR